MAEQSVQHVFFSYSAEVQDFVEALALRLQGDARLSVWFGPWHSVPGVPAQEQMEQALWRARACAVFVGGSGAIVGWRGLDRAGGGRGGVHGRGDLAGLRAVGRGHAPGNALLVAAGSYFTPLFSTLVSCVYLGIQPGLRLWVGCLLIVVGSIASWRSVRAGKH
jgi:hypothetical protein